MVNLLKTPQFQFNSQQYDKLQLDGQDADNSSFSDSFDEDNGQNSFDSFDQIGADTLGSSPWPFGGGTGRAVVFGLGLVCCAPIRGVRRLPSKRALRPAGLPPRRAGGPHPAAPRLRS